MEYAGSYALFNYRLVDQKAGMDYDNLRLIRAFEHGLDPTSSEAGFVLVHIDMVKNSGPLVAGTVDALKACEGAADGAGKLAARKTLNASLAGVLQSMQRINGVMETMWAKSKPGSYTSFRTFIFGITSQSMFPDGVVYEGVSDGKPLSFRGESGANDSMVPLCDNLLQIPMPETPLTEILKDFRQYRPSNHRDFLQWVKERSLGLDFKHWALRTGMTPQEEEALSEEEREEIKESRRLWIQILSQVRDFRWRHWCFAREYILKRTSHPTATGGSPIVTWLPNQLQAVLAEIANLYESLGGASEAWDLGTVCHDIMDLVQRQKETLSKEVKKYCEERKVAQS